MLGRGVRGLSVVVAVLGGVWLADSARALSLCGPMPPGCIRWTCINGDWVESGFKAAGTACDDRSACTTGDICDGKGTCVGTPLPGINDGNPCTTDSCNASTGAITHTPVTNSCCTSGVAKANGTSCNDGNACTQTDACQAGTCTGSNPVACTALDQCHVAGTCDPATGACSNPVKSAGSPCSDGMPCTAGDYCDSTGRCISGPLLTRGTACPTPATCGQVCDGVSPYCQPAE